MHAVMHAQVFERTLARWRRDWSAGLPAGMQVEGWLFEDQAARRGFEQELQARGIRARLRSAYKPLVHFFLEEVELDRLRSVRIAFPVLPIGAPRRFMLEAYPLSAMLPGACTLEWVEQPVSLDPLAQAAFASDTAGLDGLRYGVELDFDDGRAERHEVFAPNRLHLDFLGKRLVSGCGWLRMTDAIGKVREHVVLTEHERIFWAAMQAIAAHPWGEQEPYFDRLRIVVQMHGIERAIPGCGHEHISTSEAMHEDLYFSALEYFQRHSGRAFGDRRLKPGQIVPDIRALAADDDSPSSLDINLERFAPVVPSERSASTSLRVASAPAELGRWLAELDAPIPPALLDDVIDRFVGAGFAQGGAQRERAWSRQGREVPGLYRPGPSVPVLISGGQHANETSGIVGALRAAHALLSGSSGLDPNLALIVPENPDGYALYHELLDRHPLHMHHAARYSALGDDVEYRDEEPFFERALRDRLLAESGAQLHLNLHGYPAHEWTRPWTGYLPRGLEAWSIPKGFFLIVRHQPGFGTQARALLEDMTRALAGLPGYREFNEIQLQHYVAHAGALPFEIVNGTACSVSESQRGPGVTVVTEFPDESIRGSAFRFAHGLQFAATIAGVRAWNRIIDGGVGVDGGVDGGVGADGGAGTRS